MKLNRASMRIHRATPPEVEARYCTSPDPEVDRVALRTPLRRRTPADETCMLRQPAGEAGPAGPTLVHRGRTPQPVRNAGILHWPYRLESRRPEANRVPPQPHL